MRDLAPGWLGAHRAELAAAIGIPAEDFLAEGRDGTGLKTRVPWTRFSSRKRSPRATTGFYVVYLWAFDGSAAYLSLNQGTTDFHNGDFVRKPLEVLDSHVIWARDVVGAWIAGRTDLVDLELRDKGENSLGRGYELGNVASIRYVRDAIPDEEELLADAVSFASALGELYEARTRVPLPYEIPELEAVEEVAEDAAGNRRPARGAGFRQNKEERDLIQRHAEELAADYYAAAGWTVKRKGAPFDLELARGDERWTVEVKGTTSTGEAVALTDGEVRHHADAYPRNALVVVREIVLDRSTSPPTVRGGVLFERQPWTIEADDLRVVSYRYAVPSELYVGDGVAAEAIQKM